MSIQERSLGDVGTGRHRPLHVVVLRGCLALAAVANCVWLLRFAVPTGLSWSTTLFSELEAVGRPWSPVFRGSFLLSDVLVLGAGTLAFARWTQTRAHPSGMAGWATLAAFGATSLIDDAVPMKCVPGHDPSCRHAFDPVLIRPVIDQIHAMTSVLAALAVLASMVAFTRLAWRRTRPGALRWSPAWLITELFGTTALGGCLLANTATGLAQTAEVVVETTWLLLLAHNRPLPELQDH